MSLCHDDDGGMYAPNDLMDEIDDLLGMEKFHNKSHTASFSSASTLTNSLSNSTLSFDDENNSNNSTGSSRLCSSCDCSSRLSSHRVEISSLQQDVFALRHLFDSEMNKMKQEMKQNLLLMEERLTNKFQSLINTENNKNENSVKIVTSETKKDEDLMAKEIISQSIISSKSLAMRRSVWSGDFMDAECGDDFTPSHPSQFTSNEQEIIKTAMKESLNNENTGNDKKKDFSSSINQSNINDKNVSLPPVLAALNATALPGPPTALSISSLTALINPHGVPINEDQLIALACRILKDHGSVPVGKMGSLLHKAANDHTLPALLKERYGGLKKFLQAHTQYFLLGEDHPYNPHVALVGQQTLPIIAPITTISANNNGSTGINTVINTNRLNSLNNINMINNNNMNLLDSPSSLSHLKESQLNLSNNSCQDLLTRISGLNNLSSTNNNSNNFPIGSYSRRLADSLTLSRSLNNSNGINSRLFAIEPLLTSVIGIDCEMVGCGVDGSRSVLARASIVNYYGEILYDQYIQSNEIISDYRTHVSGIRPGDLDECNGAIPFTQAQAEISSIINGRIIVAHSIVSDFHVLGLLNHPINLIRDTAHFPLLCPDRPRSLRSLVNDRLHWMDFQCNEHDSVEDARAVISLYRCYQNEWETLIQNEQQRAAATTKIY